MSKHYLLRLDQCDEKTNCPFSLVKKIIVDESDELKRTIHCTAGPLSTRIISGVPKDAIKTLKSDEYPNLGNNVITFLMPWNGSNKVMETLNLHISQLPVLLAEANRNVRAAIASKEEVEAIATQKLDERIDKEYKRIGKMRKADAEWLQRKKYKIGEN